MKKYVLAIAIASGALFSLAAQAAPIASGPAGLQNEVTSEALEVGHCRWRSDWAPWCHGGWGWHNRWRSHWRWGSGRRWWR